MVSRTNLIAGAMQVVAIFLLDVLTDFLLRAACTCHKDSCSRRLRSFNALGVIVRDGCRNLGSILSLPERIEHPAYRRHTHGRTIAPRAVGNTLATRIETVIILKAFRMEEPGAESAAIAAHRAGKLVGELHQFLLQNLMREVRVVEKPLGNSHSADAVVGEIAFLVKEWEVVVVRVVELECRSGDIADNCS